jgi:TetR/AcrR family transcriptional regulator, mexJK operon transcriptional repressor
MLQLKTTPVIFKVMNSPHQAPKQPNHKVGRPRRGTEEARITALMNAATRVFLREGYGSASVDKVASEAGVSTRTIYERYRNKADLLVAVIGQLVDRLAMVLATAQLDRLEPRAALLWIGQTIYERARDPDSAALFRLVATEANRFPDLAARMRESDERCVDREVAAYLRQQLNRGTLRLADPDRAAKIFLQMVFSVLHERWLFGADHELEQREMDAHLQQVIDIFLLGAVPRSALVRSIT